MITEATKTRSYAELASQIEQIEKMGNWIAQSKMFGCRSEEQGRVIAMHCYMLNIPIMEYQKRNQLVFGTPSIPYDAMLAAFHEMGGKSEIISRTPELASVKLSIGGQSREFSLSWEEASQETFPYAGREDEIVATLAKGEKPTIKAKYATPRSRATMLFARVVSDAIRVMAPEVNFGTYTPEEIEDFAVVQPSNTTSNESTASTTPKETNAASKETKSQASTEASQATEEKFEENLRDAMTPELKEQITDVMAVLKQEAFPDIVQRVKQKLVDCGLAKLDDLSIGEGRELLLALEKKEIEAWAKVEILGHKTDPK